MEKKYDILTFGDLCVDLIINGKDVVPEFGQKEKLVDDYSLEMGGSCSIFACQTAKLGLRTALVGKLGKDQYGRLIYETLKEAGVSTDYIVFDENLKTGLSIALNAVEDRAILTYNGTVDEVGPEDVSDELLQTTRHLHIGSYFLMKKIQPHYPSIIKKIKEAGATVSLDTNWDPEEKWDSGLHDILPLVDIIFPNDNEAKAITGENDPDTAVKKLREIIPIVVVKKGKDGAVAYKDDKVYAAPAIDVPKKDAVGAGDSFDGGFLYGFLTGKSIEECVMIGNICGSLNVRCIGGTKGQPRLDEVLKYLTAGKW
ncbi:MAG TPA: carbohydrate kinase family protein [Clostridiaceae bacterium]|nr:carbohydrate kinase family protein [Clostridiaceae bacterium]